MGAERYIVYCRCAYSREVPEEVKQQVLAGLADSDLPFEAVPDLCELAARRDPALARWAGRRGLRVIACHGRAVKWLFHAGGAQLADAERKTLNMKEMSAEQILHDLLPDRPAEAVP